MECQKDNKPGYKWGPEGFCYVFNPNDEESKNKAHDKAFKQGQAIIARGAYYKQKNKKNDK